MRNHMNINFFVSKYVKLNEHYCFWRCTASLNQLKYENEWKINVVWGLRQA